MAQVYYSKELNEQVLLKLKQELKEKFEGCKKITIKIHFGEPGNKTAFQPDDIKQITNILKELKIDFFMYDSPVAYTSPRDSSSTYKQAAKIKGWETIGKIVTDDDFIKAQGRHFSFQICKSLIDADAVLVITHFKGHICSGFGGAIKNLGMGSQGYILSSV